ncbi:MAG: microcystin degradation protein MlrC [Planctomycetaceae bacterium]|nr:microcystin degradation protein MlrC [Planctomycetaceae bacterium]
MTRILITECKQEVSSFNPVGSHYEDFVTYRGPRHLDYHRSVRDEVGGALAVLDATDVELVSAFGARAMTSGGTLAGADFERLAGEFLDGVRSAGEVDAAYFCLHGAMSAEQESDPEGYLLDESRKILGESVPIVVSLDLHGILTDRMLRLSDAVVIYHTYPHVDFYETGQRAARLLMRIVREGVRPVTARVKIPALVRGDELITETGLIGHCIRQSQQIEAQPWGLSAGMLIGNPFTDVPELRSNSLVVTDGDEDAARQRAVELAEVFWQYHEQMQVPLTGLPESVSLANQIEGTTILMDAADATSSGASGDSNAILRELVETGYQGRALLPVVDPPAVAQAFQAGVGATIRTTLGGALDPARFPPLERECDVRLLSDGRFLSESFRQPWNSGPTAVLQAGELTVVASTRPVSLYDRSFFLAHGQNPRNFDLVVVKSPHCEPHMFADWCDRLVNVDAPGATSANVRGLGHVVCERPIFPLDEIPQYHPQADLFRRGDT